MPTSEDVDSRFPTPPSPPTPGPNSKSSMAKTGQEQLFDSVPTTQGISSFYDSAATNTSPILKPTDGESGLGTSSDSMHGGESRASADSSMSGPARAGSNRRRRPHATSSSRPPGIQPSHSPTTQNYGLPPPFGPHENTQPPTSFLGPPLHYHQPSGVPFNQGSGFVGQYPMSPHPPPVTMGHPQPSFTYPHAFHHPTVPDNNMAASTNILGSHQNVLHHPPPVYPYSNVLDGSSQHASFTGAANSPVYSPHQGHALNSPLSPSAAGPGSPLSPYIGTTPFRYSAPHFTYSQSFPTATNAYRGSYGPAAYGQHQHFPPSSPEADPTGAWWYPPHAMTPQGYESTPPSYGPRYPFQYFQTGHRDLDGPYNSASPSSGNPFPMSPNRPPSEEAPSHNSPYIGPSSDPDSAASGQSQVPDKPVIRRSYHPNPPAHRSEWVMWVGNVPSDSVHDGLWRFFNQPPEGYSPNNDAWASGVLSIFLISRSSCAFVNFDSEQSLHAAIERFNGKQLRPQEARCPKLVCRVRRKDDDLKAGVGGQRGVGLHVQWIKDQKGKAKEAMKGAPMIASDRPTPTMGNPDPLSRPLASVSLSSDHESLKRAHSKHSSSSGSYASTDSSVLTRYFPKRYFILKSLTRYDLDLSVESGLWATQKHNEGILDQAFRTSKDVYLIFGVNKSGEFYGYARMAGPVRRSEAHVSWASRNDSGSRSSRSPDAAQATMQMMTPTSPFRQSAAKSLSNAYFPPSSGKFVGNSPMPVDGSPALNLEGTEEPGDATTPGLHHRQQARSAPAILGKPQSPLTLRTPYQKQSLPTMNALTPTPADSFELDASAPVRAMRGNHGTTSESSSKVVPPLEVVTEAEEEKAEDQEDDGGLERAEDKVAEGGDEPEGGAGGREDAWGDCFKIEWLCTEKLPFYRIRHLRNPWNHEREVKVSRDGTELEPIVGQRLLDEWQNLAEPPAVGPGKPSGSTRRSAPKSSAGGSTKR